jgi:hypothetical protein
METDNIHKDIQLLFALLGVGRRMANCMWNLSFWHQWQWSLCALMCYCMAWLMCTTSLEEPAVSITAGSGIYGQCSMIKDCTMYRMCITRFAVLAALLQKFKCCDVGWANASILNDHSAFIIRLTGFKRNSWNDQAKKNMLNPGNEGTMVLQKVRDLSLSDISSHSRRLEFSGSC